LPYNNEQWKTLYFLPDIKIFPFSFNFIFSNDLNYPV